MDIGQRILMFVIGLIFVGGSIKFIIAALDSQRAALAGITYGILGFVTGMCMCVWAFTGPPG